MKLLNVWLSLFYKMNEAHAISNMTQHVLLADRQVQIVELNGLQLLLPLTTSSDIEVQRLAAHALANLSVNCTFIVFYKYYRP